jgi:hypothetical protein
MDVRPLKFWRVAIVAAAVAATTPSIHRRPRGHLDHDPDRRDDQAGDGQLAGKRQRDSSFHGSSPWAQLSIEAD